MRAREIFLRAFGAGALVLFVGAWSGAFEGEGDAFRLREPGEALPQVVLEDLSGRSHPLGASGTGPALWFFWSVFCPNCKEVMPHLAELQRDWEGRGLKVWAINVDGDRFSNAVRSYVRDVELPFPVVYDRLDGDYLVAADPLGVAKTPTLYLAGADGRIALRQVIEVDFEAVALALGKLFP
jgi:thiol-disulfide isomerase/thioredoxin